MRLYALLYPTGTIAEPVDVICSECGAVETAPNLVTAQAIAWRHDLAHDAVPVLTQGELYAKGLLEQ